MIFSAQANDYYQEHGSCRITTSEQDLFNPAVPLPFHLKIDFVLSYDVNNGQFKGQKMIVRPEVSATTPVSTSDLAPIEKAIKIERFNSGEYVYSLDIMDKSLLNSILIYTGAYRLKEHFDLPLVASGNRFMSEPIVLQTHLPIDVEDGLSYHIQLNCSVFNPHRIQVPRNDAPARVKPSPAEDILTKEPWCQNGWVVYSPTKNTRTCEWRPF